MTIKVLSTLSFSISIYSTYYLSYTLYLLYWVSVSCCSFPFRRFGLGICKGLSGKPWLGLGCTPPQLHWCFWSRSPSHPSGTSECAWVVRNCSWLWLHSGGSHCCLSPPWFLEGGSASPSQWWTLNMEVEHELRKRVIKHQEKIFVFHLACQF